MSKSGTEEIVNTLDELNRCYRVLFDMQKTFFKPFWHRKKAIAYDVMAEQALNNMQKIQQLNTIISKEENLNPIYKQLAEALDRASVFIMSYATKKSIENSEKGDDRQLESGTDEVFDDLFHTLRRVEKLAKKAQNQSLFVEEK